MVESTVDQARTGLHTRDAALELSVDAGSTVSEGRCAFNALTDSVGRLVPHRLPDVESFCTAATNSISDSMRSLFDNAAGLAEPVTYAVSVPGKRVRSLVALAVACLYPDCDRPSSAAFDAAAAVETIHEATLIHDDILDASSIRRGQLSVAARFGVRTAVFTGAYLAGTGLRLFAAQCERSGLNLDLGLLRELAEAEMLEFLPPSADPLVRYRRLQSVADGKTGALFRLAARLGASIDRVAGRHYPDPCALDRIATALGRGFQIRDDILDIRCDERLRRPGTSDLARGLVNWPLHFWIQGAADPTRALERLAQCAKNLEDISALRHEVLGSHAVEEACRVLDAELDCASGLVESLPLSLGRNVLLCIVDRLRLQ